MVGSEEKQMAVGCFPFLNESPVIFDCGSNKGGFTDIILEEFKEDCTIHLFEPNIKLLSFTEIKYEYSKNIIFNGIGLHRFEGVVDFYYFENFNNELSSLVKSDDWGDLPMKKGTIRVNTIDQYCKEKNIQHIDYLKIDVEGTDVDVLLGAENMLSADGIGIIQIEYGGNYKRANHTLKEVIDISAKYGYKIFYFKDENYYPLIDFQEDYHYENYLITKYDLHNYSTDGGWLDAFKESVKGLPKMEMCLEIGSYEGFTAKYMCENMLEEGGRVVVIDPLMDVYVEGDTSHPYFKNQYQRFKRNTRGLPIELYRGKSQDVLPELNALRFSFVYIDGNHYPPYPYLDACWAFAITKEGGYILFDDYLWCDDTQASIDKFLNEFQGHYELVQKNYQVLIKKTSNHYNEITQSYYL